jgi:hypothetical protein
VGLIDNLKSAGEQATASARTSLQETQLRHDLTQAYAELGRATYDLLARGALVHERLSSSAEAVRVLERELARLAPSTPPGQIS